MFNFFGSVQVLIALAFAVAALGLSVYGLVDALRHRPDAFAAAGKLSKKIWLALLGVAVAFAFFGVGGAFHLTSILALVASGVYLADVRPALRQVTGRGSSSDGPSRW
jgi:hypothetical protein